MYRRTRASLNMGYSYKFRQASDFWYLTGFQEPDAAVILGELGRDRKLVWYSTLEPEKTSTSRGYKMTLFSSGKDSDKEKWEGARCSARNYRLCE
jgi:intermediate cleaving peptidase 55